MTSKQSTPLPLVYVVIAAATYGLAANIQGAYTDLGAAEEASRAGGGVIHPVPIYYHQVGATGTVDDDTDVEPATKKVKTAKKDKSANGEASAKRVSKKTTIPEGRAHSLVGRACMLAGTLHHMDHKTFDSTVEAYGGMVTSKLGEADFLVCGANPGKKLDEASEKGVATLDEVGFFRVIGAEYVEPVTKKAKK